MKTILRVTLFLTLIGFYQSAYSQIPTTTLRLMGQTVDSLNVLRFSIYLKNTSADTIQFLGGQYHIDFNTALLNGGTGTYSIDGSGLSTALQPKNPAVYTTSTPGQLRLAANTPPGAGAGLRILPGDSVLVVRMKLKTSAAQFSNILPDFNWRVAPMANPVTKFGIYIGTVNTDITAGCTFFVHQNIVPVELTSFQYQLQGRDVYLNWKTATELNSNRFEIERASKGDKLIWTSVGVVKAGGTSTEPRDYSFIDKKVNSGVYIYRLKMIDQDGTFDYSKQIEAKIDLPKEFSISQNYPNPFNPSTKIEYQLPFDANVRIELYSTTGEKVADLVKTELTAGYYSVDLNSGSLRLTSGVYIYRMTAKGKGMASPFVSTKKMLLIK